MKEMAADKPITRIMRIRAITTIFAVLLMTNTKYSYSQTTTPYKLGFISSSIEEIDVAFPIYKKWHLSGQADFHLETQGTYSDQNPYAYIQRFMWRGWIEYAGFKKVSLWAGYIHNQKYEIKPTNNAEQLEQRIVVMGTLQQTLPKASLYEQVRIETKFFDDKAGVHHTIPRLRMRFGVNHHLEHKSPKAWFKNPNISYYSELMLKFAPDSYADERFDIFREMVYYSASITPNLHMQAGIWGQLQLKTNGTEFDVYYGPIISLKYSIKKKLRDAFIHHDGGSD